jgi:hypothetical protein
MLYVSKMIMQNVNLYKKTIKYVNIKHNLFLKINNNNNIFFVKNTN